MAAANSHSRHSSPQSHLKQKLWQHRTASRSRRAAHHFRPLIGIARLAASRGMMSTKTPSVATDTTTVFWLVCFIAKRMYLTLHKHPIPKASDEFNLATWIIFRFLGCEQRCSKERNGTCARERWRSAVLTTENNPV